MPQPAKESAALFVEDNAAVPILHEAFPRPEEAMAEA
jgi:hypothetical protein